MSQETIEDMTVDCQINYDGCEGTLNFDHNLITNSMPLCEKEQAAIKPVYVIPEDSPEFPGELACCLCFYTVVKRTATPSDLA